jgi:hypothetical protein
MFKLAGAIEFEFPEAQKEGKGATGKVVSAIYISHQGPLLIQQLGRQGIDTQSWPPPPSVISFSSSEP